MQKVLTIACWACIVIGSILGAIVTHLRIATGTLWWNGLVVAIILFVVAIFVLGPLSMKDQEGHRSKKEAYNRKGGDRK